MASSAWTFTGTFIGMRNFAVFKAQFIEECRHLDLERDTFATVLSRTRMRFRGAFSELKHREFTHLHEQYIQALSESIRRK